ncbi:substrate-binding periplasmic protein [Pseudoalteromonas aurantia]|uniref:Solute-binding protein family 3/N-terminal domain-containing protein n=1 Tax=Pseudoalteromonas aurantia 208 TaxID=1314867 RepID=A0ABR9EIP2_9GAMM|nr:transporter substrate-binding domain-containing protein [Pseudoalteromonas aurantia]MBE0370794.1 hypothetical protein [Pseudoalteromonas aurantia 208]
MKYLFVLLLIMSKPHAQEYHFASINYLIEQEIGRVILSEVYNELGIKITISPLPGKRAQHEARTGLKDGEIMRIYSYGKETPSTIRVPTPYYYLETMAFVRINSNIDIKTPKDLNQYRIVKVRGVKHTQNITKGMPHVTDMNSTKQLMRLVSAGLADVALTNTLDGLVMLEQLNITNVIPSPQSLDRQSLYHYVHQSLAHLVPEVDQKIIEMKQSGKLDALILKAENQIIRNYGSDAK